MALAYSSGGLVRKVRGALADVGESEVAVAAQHHRAELAARWSSARAPSAATCIHSSSFPNAAAKQPLPNPMAADRVAP